MDEKVATNTSTTPQNEEIGGFHMTSLKFKF